MSLYEEYNKSKKATTQGGLYSEFIKSKEPKTSTFSTIKSAGKEIVKGLVKLPLRAATNIDQGLSGTNREIYSGGMFGDVKPIGTQTFDTGGISAKNPNLKNVAKDALDIGGSAVEVASYLPFAGAIKGGYTAGKLLANGTKEAAKQSLKGMAFEGAVGGATQSLGQQTQQYAQDGTPISIGDVGKSAVGGAVAAPVLGILGRGLGKIFNRGEVPANLAVADEIIPAPTRKPKMTLEEYSRSQGYEPYQNPNDLPSFQMGQREARPELPTIDVGPNLPLTKAEQLNNYMVRNGYEKYTPDSELPSFQVGSSARKVEEKLPTIAPGGKIPTKKKAGELPTVQLKEPVLTKAEKYKEYRQEQGYEPYKKPEDLPSIQVGSKPKGLPTISPNKKLSVKDTELRYEPIPDQSVRSQMPDTISSIINKGKKAPELAEQAVKEASTTPKPVDTVSVDKAAKMLDTPDATDFQRQTNKLQVEQIMQKDQSEIIDIALGNKVPTDGLPAEAHYAVAANLADEMAKNGDSSLALKLSESPVRSKSGQGLQSLNITSKDNIVPILNDIRNKKEAKLSILSKKAKQKEIDIAIKGIQDEFSKVKGLPGTREQIINAINKLIC